MSSRMELGMNKLHKGDHRWRGRALPEWSERLSELLAQASGHYGGGHTPLTQLFMICPRARLQAWRGLRPWTGKES